MIIRSCVPCCVSLSSISRAFHGQQQVHYRYASHPYRWQGLCVGANLAAECLSIRIIQAWPGLAKDFLITEGARMSVPVRGRGRPPKNARAQDGLIPPIPSVPLKRGPGRPPKTAKMAENIVSSLSHIVPLEFP
jgi:hypothetical protein